MRIALTVALLLAPTTGCTEVRPASQHEPPPASVESSLVVVPVEEVEWEPLNPARGDRSPLAGTLWGDRSGAVPTGFLAKFVEGFSSPPHLHNATYRAVVLRGHLHNDDPEAAEMWMPAGSFWTQPKGEVHITAARGETNVALVEIDRGPYLVLPPEEAFDSGERPINVHISNLVWVDPPGTRAAGEGPKMVHLWGTPQGDEAHGAFVKLPVGSAAKIHSRAASFRAVVIRGQLRHAGAGGRILNPGSLISSVGDRLHEVSPGASEALVLYVRAEGRYEITRG